MGNYPKLIHACCLPDPVQTNIPLAFVTLKQDCEKAAVVNELLEYSFKELPEHHWPKEIHVIDNMPVTTSGIIDYRVLEKIARKIELSKI